MDISVIIVTNNSDTVISHGLDAMFNQKGISYEVVVVDNVSQNKAVISEQSANPYDAEVNKQAVFLYFLQKQYPIDICCDMIKRDLHRARYRQILLYLKRMTIGLKAEDEKKYQQYCAICDVSRDTLQRLRKNEMSRV